MDEPRFATRCSEGHWHCPYCDGTWFEAVLKDGTIDNDYRQCKNRHCRQVWRFDPGVDESEEPIDWKARARAAESRWDALRGWIDEHPGQRDACICKGSIQDKMAELEKEKI